MSSAEPSTSSAGAGGERGAAGAGGNNNGGGEGGSKDKSSRAKRVTSTPRQSTAVQLQLKVIRKALERLMQEREQMADARLEFQKSLGDLDNEIARVRQMLNLAKNANDFQHGRPYEPFVEFTKALGYNVEEATSNENTQSVTSEAIAAAVDEALTELFGNESAVFADDLGGGLNLSGDEGSSYPLRTEVKFTIKSEKDLFQFSSDSDLE